MMSDILTKLNFTVDINELREYYKTLQEEYWDLLPMGTAIKDHPWDKEN